MFTVLGHSGFVGRKLVKSLRASYQDVFLPHRDLSDLGNKPLGHVIDCTGNDRGDIDPFGVIDAHVTKLHTVLKNGRFDSYLYLSSTRPYQYSSDTGESTDIEVAWNDSQRLFVLSKLAGEALCFAQDNPSIRVVRLSNVYGLNPTSHSFLPSLLRDALTQGRMNLGIAKDSEKDYVSVEDVVALLSRIATTGRHRLYNLAAGGNTRADKIVAVIEKLTGAKANWLSNAPKVVVKQIRIERIVGEFDYQFKSLLDDLPSLTAETRFALTARNT